MNSGRLDAPAKINLTLEVLGVRADGFHGIRSVVVPIALRDTLSWRPASVFSFTCSSAELSGPDNLAWRAARMIGLDRLPVALHLEKRIPAGAGLGGGSSDAAAVLRAALGGAFDVARFDALGTAATLGSDVPLFLLDGPVLLEGRGERVTALGAPPAWHTVVVYPACAVGTREAYALLDSRPAAPSRPRTQSISIRLVTALQRQEFSTVQALLHNDFDGPVGELHPNIEQARRAFARAGLHGMLSGSGSAVFALTETATQAETAAAALREANELPAGSDVYVAPFARSSTWTETPAAGAVA